MLGFSQLRSKALMWQGHYALEGQVLKVLFLSIAGEKRGWSGDLPMAMAARPQMSCRVRSAACVASARGGSLEQAMSLHTS